MTPAARTDAAIYLLDKIANERRPADDIIRAWLQARRFVGSKDRRAIRNRVYGVLRRLNRLDWHLGNVPQTARNRVLADIVLEGGDPAENFDGSTHGPEPLNDSEALFADALSGKQLDDENQPGHVQVELPEWISDKLKPIYGGTFMAEMMAINSPAPMDLRVAVGRVSREQAQQALAKAGLKTSLTTLSPLGLSLPAHTDIGRTQAFKKGFIEVQDEGSQILSLLVGAKAYMNVLDYCAGAGGKTLAIADRMGMQDGHSKGKLVATDIEQRRLDRMDKRLDRAKLTDKIEKHVLAPEGDEEWLSENVETYDRVLVDAPCTGSGTWRRHPEQKKRLTPERLDELTALQTEVINSAAKFVKPGGRLIYATCSLLREENEDCVDIFLVAHPEYKLIPIINAWHDTIKHIPCPDMEGDHLRLTPHTHDTDGFFVAVLERAAK